MGCKSLLASLLLPATALGQTHTWTTDADFDAGQLVQAAHANPPAGDLVLGPTPVTKTTIVWATNYYPSWVLKLDTSTGKQLGRYDAALVSLNGVPTGARPPREWCNWANAGNCPGRVAVDNNGDVWIDNRAFGNQGTFTKFSGFPEHCIDRNHNGVIDTAHDANGDGVIDVDDPKEFYGQNDECILTTLPVGPNNEWPRAVIVDRNGKIWGCTHQDGWCYRYNPNDPVVLEAKVHVPGNPYSGAVGGQYVFISSSTGPASRINVDTLAVDTAPCPGTYGVVGDPSGNVAWLGGYFTTEGIYKADFTNHTCTHYSTGTSVTAMTLDLNGTVWAAGYSSNVVHTFNSQGAPQGDHLAGGSNPHGLSVDFQGFIWTILDNGPAVGKLRSDGSMVSTYSISAPRYNASWATPYIYSDFTGIQVNRIAPYTYFGTWTGTFDGGADGIPWSSVMFNQEPQGATPCDQPNNRCTSLKVFVRAADDPSKLPMVGFTPVSNGVALKGIAGHFVQIEADMKGPGYLTPVLSDVTVVGPCGQGISDACCIRDTDCDDHNACTVDVCPSPGAKCTHTQKPTCCNVDGDCDDHNACTTDKCPAPGGACTNVAIAGCCTSDPDCGDGDLCTQDVCSAMGGMGGTCTHPPIMGCCNSNQDCDDGNSCSIDLCSGAGGVCSHFARGGCCNVDADCDDGNTCTPDQCSGQGGTCTHTVAANCCNVDADCDDGMDCTTDKCSGPGGMCSHEQKMNCCSSPTDCSDGNACTLDTCDKGTCNHEPILRCCNLDAECDDQNVCTTDNCTGPGGTCVHKQVANCCNLNSDCDDHDPCTADKCTGAGGMCTHDPVGAGCCRADRDCDDGNACTTDRCNGGSTCEHTPLANCYCVSDDQCPTGQRCVEHSCAVPGDGGTGAAQEAYASGLSSFGGCSVGAGAASRPSTGLALFGLAALILLARRSRR